MIVLMLSAVSKFSLDSFDGDFEAQVNHFTMLVEDFRQPQWISPPDLLN